MYYSHKVRAAFEIRGLWSLQLGSICMHSEQFSDQIRVQKIYIFEGCFKARTTFKDVLEYSRIISVWFFNQFIEVSWKSMKINENEENRYWDIESITSLPCRRPIGIPERIPSEAFPQERATQYIGQEIVCKVLSTMQKVPSIRLDTFDWSCVLASAPVSFRAWSFCADAARHWPEILGHGSAWAWTRKFQNDPAAGSLQPARVRQWSGTGSGIIFGLVGLGRVSARVRVVV